MTDDVAPVSINARRGCPSKMIVITLWDEHGGTSGSERIAVRPPRSAPTGFPAVKASLGAEVHVPGTVPGKETRSDVLEVEETCRDCRGGLVEDVLRSR